MRFKFAVVLFLLLSCTQSFGFEEGTQVPGQIIVKVGKSIRLLGAKPESGVSFSALNKKFSPRIAPADSQPKIKTASVDDGGVYLLEFPSDISVDEALEEYQKAGDVLLAEPNYTFKTSDWKEGWEKEKVRLSFALQSFAPKRKAVVAVIDTGVELTHPDLQEKLWKNRAEIEGNGIDDDGNGYVDDIVGWDFVSVDPRLCAKGEDGAPEDNDPTDTVGHGTHVAGIAALSDSIEIMAVRSGYRSKSGDGTLTSFDCYRAIIYAADNGADVINMSWGGYTGSGLLREGIQYAKSKGCVLVAAAGNENRSREFYPAAYPEVIAVAATDPDDRKAGFSNYGEWVDICAPGIGIWSADLGGSHKFRNGTSMASPLVAGLSGLLISEKGKAETEDIIKMLYEGAVSVNSVNHGLEGMMGIGRVDACNILAHPFVTLDSPKEGSVVGKSVSINGVVDGKNVAGYDLFIGKVTKTEEWLKIGGGKGGRTEEGILGEWDTTGLNGEYQIRLTVLTKDGEKKDLLRNIIVDNQAPEIEKIEINGTEAVEGDVIPFKPDVKVLVKDNRKIDKEKVSLTMQKESGAKILAMAKESEDAAALFSGPEDKEEKISFEFIDELDDGTYDLRVEALDAAGNKKEIIVPNLRVIKGEAQVVSGPLNHPNPFNPEAQDGTVIEYTLNSDQNVTLYVYGLNGELVFRKTFTTFDAEGAHTGLNRVSWDGRLGSGQVAANGVYPYFIVSEEGSQKKILGRSKMLVMR